MGTCYIYMVNFAQIKKGTWELAAKNKIQYVLISGSCFHAPTLYTKLSQLAAYAWIHIWWH